MQDTAPTGLTLDEIAAMFDCKVLRAPRVPFVVTGLNTLEKAHSSQLTFLTNSSYLKYVADCQAGAILCSESIATTVIETNSSISVLVSKDPYATSARIGHHFFQPLHDFRGKSPQAYIADSANIGDKVTVYPFAYIGAGAHIEDECVLYPGAFVGAGVSLGKGCVLYPNSVVREGCILGAHCILNPGAVVGGDGFGFAPQGDQNIKIPQQGIVRLGQDIEVGSNASIDRATFGETSVGNQTKIDSLVQIGHNVQIGRSCFLAAQVGIAGSSRIGDKVILAGQVGVSGHLEIVSNAVVLGQAGVTKSISQPGLYNGNPAKPNRVHLKEMAVLSRLSRKTSTKYDKKE